MKEPSKPQSTLHYFLVENKDKRNNSERKLRHRQLMFFSYSWLDSFNITLRY